MEEERRIDVVNCTAHAVHFYDVTHTKLLRTIPPSGILPRVKVERRTLGSVDGLPACGLRYGQVQDVPDLDPSVVLIVSSLVAAALPERYDLCAPDGQIRDDRGIVVGCTGLAFPNWGSEP